MELERRLLPFFLYYFHSNFNSFFFLIKYLCTLFLQDEIFANLVCLFRNDNSNIQLAAKEAIMQIDVRFFPGFLPHMHFFLGFLFLQLTCDYLSMTFTRSIIYLLSNSSREFFQIFTKLGFLQRKERNHMFSFWKDWSIARVHQFVLSRHYLIYCF